MMLKAVAPFLALSVWTHTYYPPSEMARYAAFRFGLFDEVEAEMCDWRPGLRCSTHAEQRAALTRGVYTTAHPDGPAVHPLTGETQTLAQLNAERVVARQGARLASAALRRDLIPAEREAWEHLRDRALAQDAVALERMQGIRAQREATREAELSKLAAEVDAEPEPQPIPDGFSPVTGFDGVGRHYLTGSFRDPDGYDAAGRDARGADRTGWLATGRHAVTGTRFDPQGYGADGYHRRHGFDRLGYHRATGTQVDLQGRTVDDVTGEEAPAPELPTLHPQPGYVAVIGQAHAADDAVARSSVATALGTDTAGVDTLVRAGKLRVVADDDDEGIRYGDVAALARGAGDVRVEHARTTDAAPLTSKARVREALGTVGSRWQVRTNGTDGEAETVTVVRASTTSIWVLPDGTPAGTRPRWVAIDRTQSWGVHPDGFDDAESYGSWRRVPAEPLANAA